LSEKFLIPRRIERDVIEKFVLDFMKGTCYSCQISMELEFTDRFSKNVQISNVTEILPERANLFLTFGKTNMTQ